MKRSLLMLLAFAPAMMFVSLAGAHAFLDHATPAVGSVVHGAPAQVRLWFTQELEPAFSSVRVFDRSGTRPNSHAARIRFMGVRMAVSPSRYLLW